MTECVGLASSRTACHTKLMLSQAALTRSAPYSSTTGRTGAPARNAPVLNGSRHLPLVVVPCATILTNFMVSCLPLVLGERLCEQLRCVVKAGCACARSVHVQQMAGPLLKAMRWSCFRTSGKSSRGRRLGSGPVRAASSMRSFTWPETPCTAQQPRLRSLRLLHLQPSASG